MENGFTQINNKIIDSSLVSDGAFRTYVVLRSYKYYDGDCFPSVTSLAKRRSKHPNTIINHLNELEKAKLISRKRRGFSQSNKYTFINTTDCENEELIITKNCDSLPQPTVIQSHNGLCTKNTNINNTYFNNKKPSQKYSSIKSITNQDCQEIAEKYHVPISYVQLQLEKMRTWSEAKGKRYKNYKQALANWVLIDAQRHVERRNYYDPKQGIDARGI